jgi:hypothetical protein
MIHLLLQFNRLLFMLFQVCFCSSSMIFLIYHIATLETLPENEGLLQISNECCFYYRNFLTAAGRELEARLMLLAEFEGDSEEDRVFTEQSERLLLEALKNPNIYSINPYADLFQDDNVQTNHLDGTTSCQTASVPGSHSPLPQPSLLTPPHPSLLPPFSDTSTPLSPHTPQLTLGICR